ncbi:hypothetical protein ACO0LF_12320 [Undibacterium sp. Di27W]|uniref:hypothetical protein n=1 Tax=Undibacterium sp. Di27W TaxID=3413036 RepID=UPI003BF37159
MKSALQVVFEKFEARKKPSYDELEAALHQALKERNAFEQTITDLAAWLGRLTHAHVTCDAIGLTSTMDAFVAERVKVVQKAENQIH